MSMCRPSFCKASLNSLDQLHQLPCRRRGVPGATLLCWGNDTTPVTIDFFLLREREGGEMKSSIWESGLASGLSVSLNSFYEAKVHSSDMYLKDEIKPRGCGGTQMKTKGQDVRTCPPQAPITHPHAIWGTLALLSPRPSGPILHPKGPSVQKLVRQMR